MGVTIKYSNLLTIIFTSLFIISISCKKDDSHAKIELFDSDYKDLQLKTGFSDNGISINAENWSVEYVKDAVTGEKLQDKAGKQMVLSSLGSVELLMGWLKLEKREENELLHMSLKENFSDNPRRFSIGVLADGERDELSFTQNRGEDYAIVNKEIIEIPGSRKEYTSDEGIYEITLANNSSTARNMETSVIFKDVHYVSEFNSEDYGAFDFMNSKDSLIYMDEVLREGAVYWDEQVPYKQGESLEPYLKEGGSKSQLLVQPYTNIKVRGEMLYLERECLYSFTVKNISSGNTFEVSGTWKQKIPISATTITY